MRRMLAVAVMLATWTGVASSADLSWPRTVPDSGLRGWTGFYLGLNGGGGWAETRSDFSVSGGSTFATAKNPLMGAVGGGQLGYNWQSGLMVLGAEADI